MTTQPCAPEWLAGCRLLPVMVIENLEQAIPMAEALLAGGLGVFEVTLRTPVALAAIEQIRRYLPEAVVGAGTVLDAGLYDAALASGAQFAVSPGSTTALLQHARIGAMPLLPGVATPSEVMQARELGYSLVKFFPAQALGGVTALKAMSAALPGVSFCPTGGITPENLGAYLTLPSVVAVGGSWMLPAEAIKNGDWQRVTALTRQAISLIDEVCGA
ncbi:MAG: bifunctional 4-hydroxy-2-oxoglutarate aldolase/2-dehydro-3-deoxy-phosphogluconate aldolase [Aeromonadaceae bacterium]|nr:bifunctional 4-hydroxy-2-oxoglutarate aldolase/2-dehydro-3-deoxy-phosphogluconate aldolase [Aeromonadaceae bacterium]